MNEYLRTLITPLVTPERLEYFREAYDLLERINFVDCLDELYMITQIQDGISDNAMFLQRLSDVIYIGLKEMLLQHEVIVNDDIPEWALLQLMQSITMVDAYTLPYEILEMHDAGYSGDELLAAVAANFGYLDFDELVQWIVQVSDNFTTNLINLLNTRASMESVVDNVPIEPDAIRRMNLVMIKLGNERISLAKELLDSGVRVGIGWDLIETMAFDGLEKIPVQQVGYELLGLLVLAGMDIKTIKEKAQQIMEDFTDVPRELTLIEQTFKNALTMSGIDYVTT